MARFDAISLDTWSTATTAMIVGYRAGYLLGFDAISLDIWSTKTTAMVVVYRAGYLLGFNAKPTESG